MKSITIVTFLLVVGLNGFGQDSKWVNGHLIPKPEKTDFKKDTIFCKISYPNNFGARPFYKIKVLIDDEKVIKLQASEIVSFTRGSEYFKSGYFNGNYSFAKQIISGKISLYRNKQVSMGVSSASSYVLYHFQLPNSKNMIYFPSNSKYKKFIKFMESYFSEDKELMKLVIDKTLNSKDVIEIIEHYNEN